MIMRGLSGTSSPEVSGEPGTNRNYFLDNISFKISGFCIIFFKKILLFIRLIKRSKYKASILFEHSKVKITSQSFAILVKELL